MSSVYHKVVVLSLLEEAEEGGLICGTAKELSSFRFLLDLMFEIMSLEPICPPKPKPKPTLDAEEVEKH